MKYYVLCFSFIVTSKIFSQPITDDAFKWFNNEKCLSEIKCSYLYLKAEKDPEFVTISKLDFDNLISKTILEMKLDTNANGCIKLKLAFNINKNVCVLKTGLKGIILNKSQLNILIEKLNLIDNINNGRQDGADVNCQGIVYVIVFNGKSEECRYVNFKFKKL
jgi:hypothetical protein